MRIDPEHCTDPVLLAAEVRRLRAVIASGDSRLAALQALAQLDEELGLPRTPTPPSTPDECSVPTGCIEDVGKRQFPPHA